MIDVVAVVFNPSPIAVESLKGLKEHNKGLGKVILINNCSTKNLSTVAEAQKYADINVNLTEQVSLAEAWNIGISKSDTQFVVITNDDILYTKDWLVPLEKAMTDDPSLGVLQPFNTLSGLPENFPNNYTPEDKVSDIPHSNFVGCCFAINKAHYKALKEYDNARWPNDTDYTWFYSPFYPFGSEDQDFYRRIRAIGLKTLCHFGSYIHHFTGETMRNITTFSETRDRSMRMFNERWDNVQDSWHDERPL